jgi:hypothetical protein
VKNYKIPGLLLSPSKKYNFCLIDSIKTNLPTLASPKVKKIYYAFSIHNDLALINLSIPQNVGRNSCEGHHSEIDITYE